MSDEDDPADRLAKLQQEHAESGSSRLDAAAGANNGSEDPDEENAPENDEEAPEEYEETLTVEEVDDEAAGVDSDSDSDDEDSDQSEPSWEAGEALANEESRRSFAEILDEEIDSDDGPHLTTWTRKYAPLMRAIGKDDPAAAEVREPLREFLADELECDVSEIGESRSELIAEAIRYLLVQAEEEGGCDALQELREGLGRKAMRDV